MDDPTRRDILKAGAAAAAMAAMPRVFAQQASTGVTGKFYERGPVRIRYEEAGAGFPLMLLPGGGLNATIAFFTRNSPFNAIRSRSSRVSIAASRRTCATPLLQVPTHSCCGVSPENPARRQRHTLHIETRLSE
jgi:hypothetical protein